VGALILAGVAFALFVKVHIPSRPVRSIEALRKPHEQPLNVVFILVDMLRADHLSAYGYKRQTSPLLADLAASGVRFENVESQSSWTKCSMASLWTGIFPPRTGVTRFDHALSAAARMPAEIFKKAGYTTAGIWRNGWVAPNFGFGQGFDVYIRPSPRKQASRKIQRHVPGTQRLPGTDIDLSQAAVEFLKNNGQRPFLLYLHMMDVHQYTYDETAAAQGWGASLPDSYDAAIHWTDRNIAWVVEKLEDLDLLDHTLVVIAADHGEAFREHGVEGHARNLYQEVTHVPLIFLLPFRLSKPLVVKPLVRNVDIWPTILDIAGLPPLQGVDGRSLVPLMLAAARGESPDTPLSYAYLDQRWGKMNLPASPLVSITDPKHGRVAWNTTDPKRSLRIFDHRSDLAEQINLAAHPPDWAVPLQRKLEKNLERPQAWGKPREVEINDMYRAQLQALGYVVK